MASPPFPPAFEAPPPSAAHGGDRSHASRGAVPAKTLLPSGPPSLPFTTSTAATAVATASPVADTPGEHLRVSFSLSTGAGNSVAPPLAPGDGSGGGGGEADRVLVLVLHEEEEEEGEGRRPPDDAGLIGQDELPLAISGGWWWWCFAGASGGGRGGAGSRPGDGGSARHEGRRMGHSTVRWAHTCRYIKAPPFARFVSPCSRYGYHHLGH